LVTGMPAETNVRAIRSFSAWCLAVLPGAFLQTKLWTPVELTNDPHWHWCGTHRLRPSRKPTPTLTASSSNRRPHEMTGMAKSQSPLRQGSCQERCSVKGCSQGGFKNGSICENARSVPEWRFGRQSIWYCAIGCRPSCRIRLQMLAIGTDTARQNVILEVECARR